MGLPDPQRSQAVLIGTSKYQDEKLPDLPPVGRNISDLAALLTDSVHGVVPTSHCIALEDEGDIRRIGRQLKMAARQAEDLLLVYYAGHGLVGGRKYDLYLALPDSEWSDPEFNSLEYDKLRNTVLNSPANTKVIILDCCFSGRVITDTMADSVSQMVGQVEIDGTYVLTSALRDQVALSLPGEVHTAFTGRLLRLLHDGIPSGPEFLTIDDLYRQLFATMRAEGLPQPQKRGTGNADLLALARNRVYTARAIPDRSQQQISVTQPDKNLDWEAAVQLLRDIVHGQGPPVGRDHYENPESMSDPLGRAAMLRDVLADQTRALGADHQNTLRTRHLLAEDLEGWGYRDRAATILRALRPATSIRSRDRQERLARARREACVDLLRAACELRTRVANNFEYHGDEMAARLAEVRTCDRASQIHALTITLLGTDILIQPAERLAAAVTRLVAATLDGTDLNLGVMILPPDFSELDACSESFRRNAIDHARQGRPERAVTATREACVDLLRAACELRTHVANNFEYHGDEMAARLAEVRTRAAAAQVHALNLALLAPDLAEEASMLAMTATRLAADTADFTDLHMGAMFRRPDFSELDACSESFRRNAIDHARQGRPERAVTATREACVDLLRAVSELRTHVANNFEYHGDEMAARLAEVRTRAAAAQVHALNLALLAPDLAEEASMLAMTATRLAADTADFTDLHMGAMFRRPDFSELDACSESFRRNAVGSARR